MKKTLIAFDIDGTLRNNVGDERIIKANERIRTLLIILASMKNTKIMVWSGGGELYARQITRELGLAGYVDIYADKMLVSCMVAKCPEPNEDHWHFGYDGPRPDIAVDDIQSFSLGTVNLIVREK